MIGDWLRGKIGRHASHAGAREVERFVGGLEAAGDHDLGVLVAVATAVRINLEAQGVLPEGLFQDHTLPSAEKLGAYQWRINRVTRQFARMRLETDAVAANIWSYSLRCLNVPGLRPLGRRMWVELARGFPHVEDALRIGEQEKGEPFPPRVWQEWGMVPSGLESE